MSGVFLQLGNNKEALKQILDKLSSVNTSHYCIVVFASISYIGLINNTHSKPPLTIPMLRVNVFDNVLLFSHEASLKFSNLMSYFYNSYPTIILGTNTNDQHDSSSAIKTTNSYTDIIE